MHQDTMVVRCGDCGTRNRVPSHRVQEGPKCGKCGAKLHTSHGDASPVNVTDQTFQHEVLTHHCPVLVDCWAEWCGPCRSVAPIMDALAAEYAGRVRIAKLNVDENPATSSRYQIRSIPTMLLFRDGRLVDTLVGALPRQAIEQRLKSML